MKYTKLFRIEPGSKVDLAEIDAGFTDEHESQERALPEIELQPQDARTAIPDVRGGQALPAGLPSGRDLAGKDGTINHVLSAINSQGCTVTGFKVPTPEEAGHDFLWRYHQHVPRKGQVAIFNRSHYEDVLVQRVHDMVPKEVWSKRYEHINHFEQLLYDSDTHILKFYLHIDPRESSHASSSESTTRNATGRSAMATMRSGLTGTPTPRPSRRR